MKSKTAEPPTLTTAAIRAAYDAPSVKRQRMCLALINAALLIAQADVDAHGLDDYAPLGAAGDKLSAIAVELNERLPLS